jgi:GT2 family glycosyltransferase
MERRDLVTTIVVNWNGRAYLDKCLSSLLAQTCLPQEIVLVDNGSTDGSAEYVEASYSGVRVIRLPENLGFAAANNLAIRQSSGAYVALLNNDAYAESDWLARLVEAAESGPRVGMCASKMVFAHQPDVLNSTGVCVDRAGIAWDRRGGEADDDHEKRPVEIFGACGGAALYRRAMLDEVGLFDEDFFAYMEDVDLAWRARGVGWRCLYVPAARVYHAHSATGVEGSPFKSFQLGRNKVWLLAKNYPFKQLWMYAPLVAIYDFAAVIYALVARRDVHALRGRLAGLAGIARVWQKRRGLPLPQRHDVQWLQPLEAPWRVMRRYRHLAPAR